ncbi:uncharacterized protein BJ171DRAFT_503737 [Polychytrium aggregatum]|uniref:uncharacterized protein n=1 Tax=Polychytrium aggregatum TaxID=110093 RepID=UPI0022FE2B3F|nr:uncharacterized protein BJ171DRAFT_503737 [Polychytrium aggregatum]KAI9204820.1 hypothetical protein BJ171DRAFT_503737 [Polychytrium aggregatum]
MSDQHPVVFAAQQNEAEFLRLAVPAHRKFTVKSPLHPHVYFSFLIPGQSTVQELKNLLHHHYPGQPSANSQRLIHSGALLVDGVVVESLFKSSDPLEVQTIHIVLKPGVSQPLAQPLTVRPASDAPQSPFPALSSAQPHQLSRESTLIGSHSSSVAEMSPQTVPQPQAEMLFGAGKPVQDSRSLSSLDSLIEQAEAEAEAASAETSTLHAQSPEDVAQTAITSYPKQQPLVSSELHGDRAQTEDSSIPSERVVGDDSSLADTDDCVSEFELFDRRFGLRSESSIAQTAKRAFQVIMLGGVPYVIQSVASSIELPELGLGETITLSDCKVVAAPKVQFPSSQYVAEAIPARYEQDAHPGQAPQHQHQHQQQQPAQAAAPAAAAPPAAAALAGPENENQPVNMIGLLSRLVLMVYLLTQNASTWRIVLVILGAIVFFLAETGQLRIFLRIINPNPNPIPAAGAGEERRWQQPNPNPNANAGAEGIQGPVAAQEGLPGAGDDAREPNGEAGHQAQAQAVPRRTLLQEIYFICYTFVASLFPDRPVEG